MHSCTKFERYAHAPTPLRTFPNGFDGSDGTFPSDQEQTSILPNKNTIAEAVSKISVDFGIPQTVLTDQGRNLGIRS